MLEFTVKVIQAESAMRHLASTLVGGRKHAAATSQGQITLLWEANHACELTVLSFPLLIYERGHQQYVCADELLARMHHKCWLLAQPSLAVQREKMIRSPVLQLPAYGCMAGCGDRSSLISLDSPQLLGLEDLTSRSLPPAFVTLLPHGV